MKKYRMDDALFSSLRTLKENGVAVQLLQGQP